MYGTFAPLGSFFHFNSRFVWPWLQKRKSSKLFLIPLVHKILLFCRKIKVHIRDTFILLGSCFCGAPQTSCFDCILDSEYIWHSLIWHAVIILSRIFYNGFYKNTIFITSLWPGAVIDSIVVCINCQNIFCFISP